MQSYRMYQGYALAATVATVLGTVGFATPAAAAEPLYVNAGPYASIGYAYTGYETLCNGDSCDRRANGVRLAGGWTLPGRVSLEALYLHAGDFTASNVTSVGTPFHGRAKLDVVGATIGYEYYLLDTLSIGAHVGAAAAKAEFTPGPAPAIAGGRTTGQFIGGLTASWHFSHALSLRLDWDHTRAKMNRFNGNVDAGSIGVCVGF